MTVAIVFVGTAVALMIGALVQLSADVRADYCRAERPGYRK